MRWRQLFAGIDEPAYVVRDDGSADVSRETIEKLDREAGMPIGSLTPVVEAELAKAMEVTPEDTAVLADQARALPNPAPGLAETNAAGVPAWAEMRAKYPPLPWRKIDTQKVRAIVGTNYGLLTTAEAVEATKMWAQAAKATGHPASDVGTVDFRAMLKDDDAAWSAKTRLAKVLGREYLATRLVDQLDPETAAQLADRLDTLVSQAVAETEMRISGEVQGAVSAYSEQLAADRAARRKQAEEASRERFHGHSRLS